jgi:hypothetical protein
MRARAGIVRPPGSRVSAGIFDDGVRRAYGAAVSFRRLRWPLAGALFGVFAAGAARATAPTADERAALDVVANTHPAKGAVVRDQAWNAQTVKHLAAWVRGDAKAASAAEIALLNEELSRPLALSVSGAVSLGNYQGGFLYYLNAAFAELRALDERAAARGGGAWTPAEGSSPLGLVTGASSGSINAFVAAVASCQEPEPAPRKSLFWKVWVPVGGEQLTAPDDVTRDGLLSIRPIETAAKAIRKAWGEGPWRKRPCLVDVGLSATRVRSRQVQPLDGVNLALPVQNEKLVFSLNVDGNGTPKLEPLEPPADDPRAGLLRKLLRRPKSYDIDVVNGALAASSAFSFAFPPRWLHLLADDAQEHDDAWFTDGGVFDDRPVGLAVELRRWRLARDKRDPKTHTHYLIQDPDVTVAEPNAAPAPASGEKPQPDRATFVDTWMPFAEDFLDTAFEIELLDALEREPTLVEDIEIPPRKVPVAGAYLMEFLAFAEKDFRIFDFFVGMVDAWEHLAETSLAFQVLRGVDDGPTFVDAPELACLMAYRTRDLTHGGDGVPAACEAVGTNLTPPDGLLRRNLEALAHASAVTKAWRRKQPPALKSTIAGEQEQFLGALGTAPGATPGAPPAPYVYRDLLYRGDPADVDTVDRAIRDKIQIILERTTSNQPLNLGRFVVGGVGKALVNYTYSYRPPDWIAAAGFVSDRGLELGGAWRLPLDHLPRPFDLRLDVATRVTGVHATQDYSTTPDDTKLAFTYSVAAHLTNELQLQGLWSRQTQSTVQLSLSGGWALEWLRTWSGPLLWRQGPEAILGVTVFQRLYFDLAANWYRDDCANNNQCSHIVASQRVLTHPVVDGDWGLRFSFGYRFYVD